MPLKWEFPPERIADAGERVGAKDILAGTFHAALRLGLGCGIQEKIEGSINIPQDQNDFVERVSATVTKNKDAEIVVYCASQECDSSTKAAKKLDDAGFKNVDDYEDGAKDWNQSVQSAKS